MAKVTFPSYIKGSQGRMKDMIISKWKGIVYMRHNYKSQRPPTEKQVYIRSAFSSLVSDWKYFGGIISTSWRLLTEDRNLSGYNAFIGSNLTHRRAGKPIQICPGTGEEILMNFTAVPGREQGKIMCSFLPPESSCHVTFFARNETLREKQPVIIRFDAGADTLSPFILTGLQSGALYSIYAVVTDAAYARAETVSPSVAAMSAAG